MFVGGSKFRANAGINNSWDKKYDAINDEYICPEGERLKNRGVSVSKPWETTYRVPNKAFNFGVCTKSKAS